MGSFGRFIGIILLIIGILVMLLGLLIAVFGVAGYGLQAFNRTPLMPMMPYVYPGMMGMGFGLFLGAIVFIWGLTLAALGPAIFLLADIARDTAATRRQLAYREERTAPPPPIN